MEYRVFGNDIVLRIQKGEDIPAVLQAVCEKEQVKLASVIGLGVVGEVTLGVFNTERFAYETQTYTDNGTVTFTPVGLKAARAQYAAFLASQPVAAEPEATAAPEATAEPSAAPEATAAPEPEPTAQPEAAAKPKQTPAPTSTAQPAAPTQSPRTGDNASLMTWVGIPLVCGTALAGLYVYKKRKQK